MNDASLDFPLAASGLRTLAWGRTASLAGAPLVIWDAQPLADRVGGTTLDPAASDRILAQARYWRTELAHALAEGAVVAVLLPAQLPTGVHTLQEVVALDVLEALPAPRPRLTAISPHAVCATAGEPFRSFFESAGALLAARAAVQDTGGRPICVVAAGNAIAGTYEYRHPGHLVLLPGVRPDLPPAQRAVLLAALRALAARLRRTAWHGDDAAGWAAAWRLPEEDALAEHAAALTAQRREVTSALERTRARIESIALARRLVTGGPEIAGHAAAHVLHALGSPAHADAGDDGALVCEHAGTLLVLLPIGTSRDGDAREVVARVLALARRHGDARAGLLYCENDRPPGERAGPPPALLREAATAGVAVITAEMLLAAYRERNATVLDRLIAARARPR